MPASAKIARAADEFRFNNGFVENTVSDLSLEEWFSRPGEKSNHIAWLVGHLVWTRNRLLDFIGTEWTRPWLNLFARGVKLADVSQYPTPEELMGAWRDVAGVLADALENASDEVLSQPATQGPPSADGKLSGIVNFLAYHETYHIGQASYVRAWLGHKCLMG